MCCADCVCRIASIILAETFTVLVSLEYEQSVALLAIVRLFRNSDKHYVWSKIKQIASNSKPKRFYGNGVLQ